MGVLQDSARARIPSIHNHNPTGTSTSPASASDRGESEAYEHDIIYDAQYHSDCEAYTPFSIGNGGDCNTYADPFNTERSL